MATVDEEFRRQYRDVAPFNPTSKDRAHNTQQFIIFLQKMSQVQPLLRILVQATKPTFATPQTGDYDTYVNSLEDNQGAVFESHLLYLVSYLDGGPAFQLPDSHYFTPTALLDGGGTAHESKGCRDVPVLSQGEHFYIPADNHIQGVGPSLLSEHTLEADHEVSQPVSRQVRREVKLVSQSVSQ